MFLTKKNLTIVIGACLLAACSSPPEPPLPSGEKVAINPQALTQKTASAQKNKGVKLVDDLSSLPPLAEPVVITSSHPAEEN